MINKTLWSAKSFTIPVTMEVLNNSLNQTLQQLNVTEDEAIIEAGYQIIVPLLIGLSMSGFLLNSIILVSILSSKLLMRTRAHDKYLNIIISMVSDILLPHHKSIQDLSPPMHVKLLMSPHTYHVQSIALSVYKLHRI